MDVFLDAFGRKTDQQIVDYNAAWDRVVLEVEKVVGQLGEEWKAHMYLRKMNIAVEKEHTVLSATYGNYTVEALQKSALMVFPDMKKAV